MTLAAFAGMLQTATMPASHGRQKQLAKQKKKREQARHQVPRRPSPDTMGQAALVREAAGYSQGPAFLSGDWAEEDMAMPRLVTVVVTRRVPGGFVVPSIRARRPDVPGDKNAFVARPFADSLAPGLHREDWAGAAGGAEALRALRRPSRSSTTPSTTRARSASSRTRTFPSRSSGPASGCSRRRSPTWRGRITCPGSTTTWSGSSPSSTPGWGRGRYDFVVGPGGLVMDE